MNVSSKRVVLLLQDLLAPTSRGKIKIGMCLDQQMVMHITTCLYTKWFNKYELAMKVYEFASLKLLLGMLPNDSLGYQLEVW